MLSRERIEEVLSRHLFIRPPRVIYILSHPIIYPELRAFVLGLNPAFERETIILSSNATEETLLHECVPPETLVFTSQGVKPISMINVGDHVLGHDKNFHEVREVKKFHYKGTIFSIFTTHINIPVRVTPNHPIYVRRNNKKYGCIFPSELKSKDRLLIPTIETVFDLGYRRISRTIPCKVEGGYVVRNLRSRGPERNTYWIPDIIPHTDEFLELCGYYVAEGGAQEGGIWFSLGKHEGKLADHIVHLIDYVFKIPAYVDEPPSYRGLRVLANSTILLDLFKSWFGEDVYTKRVPSWILWLPRDKQLPFLKGYFVGDGSKGSIKNKRWGKKYDYLSARTVSPSLAFSLFLILLRHGVVPQLELVKNKGFKESPIFSLKIQGVKARSLMKSMGYGVDEVAYCDRPYAHLSGPFGYLCLKVRDVRKEEYNGLVYNLEVQSSSSFTAGLRAVHNSLHTMGLTERLAPRLARRLVRMRERFPPIVRRHVKYREEAISSAELERYGLKAYARQDGRYAPTELFAKRLILVSRW